MPADDDLQWEKLSFTQQMKRHTLFLVKFATATLGLENWLRLKTVFWDEAKRTLTSTKEFQATLKSK